MSGCAWGESPESQVPFGRVPAITQRSGVHWGPHRAVHPQTLAGAWAAGGKVRVWRPHELLQVDARLEDLL